MNLLAQDLNIEKEEKAAIAAAKRNRKKADLDLIVNLINGSTCSGSKFNFFRFIKSLDKDCAKFNKLPNKDLSKEEERQIRLIIKNKKNIETSLRWAKQAYENGFIKSLKNLLAEKADHSLNQKISDKIKRDNLDAHEINILTFNTYYENKVLLVEALKFLKSTPFFEFNKDNQFRFNFNAKNWSELSNINDIHDF